MKLLFVSVLLILDVYSTCEQMGLIDGSYTGRCWGYYTILSNLLVIAYFLAVLLNELLGVLPFVNNAVVSFTVMMSITLTFLIFHFMLMPDMVRDWKEGIGMNPYRLGNLGVHYICPLMTIIHFLVFIDRSNMEVWQGLYWLASPCAYLVYAAIRAKLGYEVNPQGDRWPYWFMDFDRLGFKKAMRNLVCLLTLFGLLGLLIAYVCIKLR